MKKVVSIFYAIVAAMLFTTSVLAGPSIKLSGGANNVDWELGSLVAKGNLILGNTNVTIALDASGTPEVICTNQGANPAPGQNPANISATGAQDLMGQTKNGKAPFDVKASPPETIPGLAGGCPNNNWTAQIVFVYWEHAVLTVMDPVSGAVLLQQAYDCETTRHPDNVRCWAVE